MAARAKDRLYYGDNLEILRRYVKDETVDLVYLDPPFKSNQDYNVLFAERDGSGSAAQIRVFEDTWTWDQGAAAAFHEATARGDRTAQALVALRSLLGESDMMAYLAMMAPRLQELHRVLRETGSIYLHCDPTASHYLKLLMDAVFGPTHFRSEIIWKRTFAHGGARRYGPVHDVILFYTKSDEYTWNPQLMKYSDKYVENFFRFKDPDGKMYRATILTGSGTRTGSSGRPWRGIDPTNSGRHWAIPGFIRPLLGEPPPTNTQEALDRLDGIGRILWPDKKGGVPSFKQYLDDFGGAQLQDVWVDIPPLGAQSKERLGYPTQKPEALLERILASSSNRGDLVLDPFCGCGTAVVSAQRLERRWIGIDITHLAIALIRHRMEGAFGERLSVEVVGEPKDNASARELAKTDPYQFQWWSLGLVGARPVEQKKGADKGIDGRRYFEERVGAGRMEQIIFSVKAGNTGVSHVRDLRGVIEREKAAMGILITLHEPTKEMRKEAAAAGIYESPGWHKTFPRLQVVTVAELLEKRAIQGPPASAAMFKRAERVRESWSTLGLPFDEEAEVVEEADE